MLGSDEDIHFIVHAQGHVGGIIKEVLRQVENQTALKMVMSTTTSANIIKPDKFNYDAEQDNNN